MVSKEKIATPQSELKTGKPEYPGLNYIAFGIGYLESFLAVVAEPMLIAGFIIATIDFLTGGGLLASGLIKYAWAITQAIAIDASFIVTWRRAFKAFSSNHWLAGSGYVILGLSLGFVIWAAVNIQSLSAVVGIGSSGAMAHLSLNAESVTYIRSAVVVIMGIVVALSNHQIVNGATAPVAHRTFLPLKKLMDKYLPETSTLVSVQSEHPAQKVNAQTGHPAQDTGDQTGRPASKVSDQNEHPEWGASVQNGHLVSNPDVQSERLEHPVSDQIGHSERPAQLRILPITGAVKPIDRVRQALAQEPDASDRRIAALSNVSPSTAKKYRLQIEGEQAGVQSGQELVASNQ